MPIAPRPSAVTDGPVVTRVRVFIVFASVVDVVTHPAPAPAARGRSVDRGSAAPWIGSPAAGQHGVMQRDELADFLRRRREGIRPAEVGIADGPRRRTSGLRREEVAMLAGMSVDYVVRLEQGRRSGEHTS